jgi:hypothetical protein
MNNLLLRNVKLTHPQVASMLQYQCRVDASTASSSNTVVQTSPVVLDNQKPPPPLDHERMRMHPRIGNREIVGYGLKGKPEYFDMVMFPCPSIRWEADTPQIVELKKKEKSDWKQLSIEEKKKCKFYIILTFVLLRFLFSISSKFPSNIRRIYSSNWYLEVGHRMDINFISWCYFSL